MSNNNINLCAVNKRTRYCDKCDVHLSGGEICEELREEYSHYDSETGEYYPDPQEM